MNKPKLRDAMAEAKKYKNFSLYLDEAGVRIRFAAEVFNLRQKKGLSQQALAGKAMTTQKVISKIENGDVNLGIGLFYRVATALQFTETNLATVFNSPVLWTFNTVSTTAFPPPTSRPISKTQSETMEEVAPLIKS